jgi:hypothetical protein
MEDRKLLEKNAMHIAIEVLGRGPSVSGPTKETLLILAGASREITLRNQTLVDTAGELEVLLGFFHAAHRGLRTTEVDSCPVETCRRTADQIRRARELAAADTAVRPGY